MLPNSVGCTQMYLDLLDPKDLYTLKILSVYIVIKMLKMITIKKTILMILMMDLKTIKENVRGTQSNSKGIFKETQEILRPLKTTQKELKPTR